MVDSRRDVVDVPGPSPTAQIRDSGTLDRTTALPMPTGLPPLPEYDVVPGYSYVPDYSYVPGYNYVARCDRRPENNYDPGITPGLLPHDNSALMACGSYGVEEPQIYREGLLSCDLDPQSFNRSYDLRSHKQTGHQIQSPYLSRDISRILEDPYDLHITGGHDERNLVLNRTDLFSTGIRSTADRVECGSTSRDPYSLDTAYAQGHDSPTASAFRHYPMLSVEEDLIGIGDGLAQSPVVGTPLDGSPVLRQEDNHPPLGVLPGDWTNIDEQDVPLANINVSRAVDSARGTSSPDTPGRLLPENVTADVQSGRHIICLRAGVQTDVLEEDDNAESVITTDGSLSFGLISEAGDSQATEDPAQTTPAYDLFKRVLRRLVVEFHGTSITSTCPGSSSVNTTAKGTGPPHTALSPSAISLRCKGKRRSSGAPGDKDDDDEECPPNKKPKNKETPPPTRSAFLACPFWKLDPNTHWGCYAKRLTAISYVKQHLRRNHTPAHYCQVCFTIFKHADTLDDHVMATPRCTRGSTARLDGISPAQTQKLRVGTKGSVEQQWFAIWDILFPKARRPLSVHIDYHQSEDFASFHEFIQRKGVQIVREELGAGGVVSVSGDEEGRPSDQAIERALEGLFERFRSDRLSYTATSSMTQTAGEYTEPLTQHEAMVASSATDSGVGVSSVFSSGGSGAGDEASHQPTSIANPFARPPPHSGGQPQGPVTINQPEETDEIFGSLFDEFGGAGFTDDLCGGDGEDRILWDDFARECNK